MYNLKIQTHHLEEKKRNSKNLKHSTFKIMEKHVIISEWLTKINEIFRENVNKIKTKSQKKLTL